MPNGFSLTILESAIDHGDYTGVWLDVSLVPGGFKHVLNTGLPPKALLRVPCARQTCKSVVHVQCQPLLKAIVIARDIFMNAAHWPHSFERVEHAGRYRLDVDKTECLFGGLLSRKAAAATLSPTKRTTSQQRTGMSRSFANSALDICPVTTALTPGLYGP
jgi:hypothetical protein